MSGILDRVIGSAWFFGTCEECRQAKPFHTERERDLWLRNHAHQQDPS